MATTGELDLLAAMNLKELEARAWAVVYQHNREISGPAVCKALDQFLQLAAIHAQTNWKAVEDQLQRLTSPILDNNYAYKTMTALKCLYSKPLDEFSERFRWAPRGLLMYGLNTALQRRQVVTTDASPTSTGATTTTTTPNSSSTTTSNVLTPKNILQWLSRLSLSEFSEVGDDCPTVNETIHIMVHTLFSIWSCLYDSDHKARLIKYQIAKRKLDQVDLGKLCAEVFSQNADQSSLPKTYALYDYFWLRHRLRLQSGGFLPQLHTHQIDQDGPTVPFSEIVKELITDYQSFKAPRISEYWKREKFSSFAFEVLQCLPHYYQQQQLRSPSPTGGGPQPSDRADDIAFDQCVRYFLMDKPTLIIKAWEIRNNCQPSLNDETRESLLEVCLGRYLNLPLRVNFHILADALTPKKYPWMDPEMILCRPYSEADASGVILSVLKLDVNHPWRIKFMNELYNLTLDSKLSGRFIWVMIGSQAGLVKDLTNQLKLFEELIENSESDDKWFLDFKSYERKTKLEIIVLTAATIMFDEAKNDQEFDKIAQNLFKKIIGLIKPFDHGLERINFLALCLSIYLGTNQVTGLMKKLSIRAVQSYSLAWCVDGMERLWKSNAWTIPRHNCETPNRVQAQVGSTAMLTLDAGSLQSLVYQVEQAVPKIDSFVNTARIDSLTVDSLNMKKADASANLMELRQIRYSPMRPPEGDFVPLVGTVGGISRQLNGSSGGSGGGGSGGSTQGSSGGSTQGLFKLIERLCGIHIHGSTGELQKRLTTKKLSYPSSCHIYLELLFRGEPPKSDVCKFLRKMTNNTIFSSADSLIKTARTIH